MSRLDALLFVGFNKRVAALDRESGQLRWQWRAPRGSSYVSLLLDGDCLFVSVNGYLYCLDAETGEQLWLNPMKGFGTGVTSLASTRGHTDHAILGKLHRSMRQPQHRRQAADTQLNRDVLTPGLSTRKTMQNPVWI